MSLSASQSICGSPAGKVLKVIPSLTAKYNLNIQIAGVILGATLGLCFGAVFRNQIEQIIAVDVVFAERRRRTNVGFNMLNRLTQRVRQPGIADDEYCR